jgi:hypothetical protein
MIDGYFSTSPSDQRACVGGERFGSDFGGQHGIVENFVARIGMRRLGDARVVVGGKRGCIDDQSGKCASGGGRVADE